ncbi:MAG TPA: lycopene cyclase domain-containing protein [Pseudolysinimonas sp.]|nr:lycopene cyclase domain-containing protein [Pseudolysinimonas sp.]
MMTYWLLNLAFLALVVVVVVATLVSRRAPSWRLVGLAAIPLVILTAVFDNVLVGVGIVAYDPHRISGVRLGVAPVEDFAYAIAAVVLLPCLWSLLTPRAAGAPRSTEAPR